MQLSSALTELKGIGPAVAVKFRQLGLITIADLIDYYPRRYDDFSVVLPAAGLNKPGAVTIQAKISSIKGRYVRRGMHITEAVASDDSGSVRLVWFNQPYREQAMKRTAEYYISGNFELSHQRFAIQNPRTELVSDVPLNTARIVPVYRETKGLNSRQIRAALGQVLSFIDTLPETLPDDIITKYELVSRAAAIRQLHFPDSAENLETARYRLGFEEVFQLIVASLLTKAEIATEKSPAIPFDEALAKRFVQSLPFDLTADQRRVVWQIFLDMQQTNPMNRLVEGDVGSGKTVVAAMAAVMVMQGGHQVALMAPTELLARQHAATLHTLLQPLGIADQVGLLVGSLTAAQKKLVRQHIADGDVRLMVGTSALIQEMVDMQQLELIVIDEQHRFGVDQRKELMRKAGHMPHVLSLTATPIPRSLALTLYGELDVSILATKPANRRPIITELVPPANRAELYKKIDQQLAAGRQAFIVCPLVNEGVSGGTSVETLYEQLSKHEFKHRRVGLLHGKLKPADKNSVMASFAAGELDLLVCTTVIEVGVDVPNATVMAVSDSERFGLAQIHQLRGRVGRGEHQGYCYLLLSDNAAPSRRLRALEQSSDGFKLAELDLELRGPGAIYGSMQHGELDLRVARLTDTSLITAARQAAEAFLASGTPLLDYKELAAAVSRLQMVTNLN